ncbi:MAG TPA: hypothetical protein VN456_01600 [Desulfosporosinus sp.]|nr:hypothetical protein [Desulfosporosinus sp.]
MGAKGNCSVEFYLEDKLIYAGASTELIKTQPDWNRKLGIGDRITVNGVQRRIIKQEFIFNGSQEKKTILKVKVK